MEPTYPYNSNSENIRSKLAKTKNKKVIMVGVAVVVILGAFFLLGRNQNGSSQTKVASVTSDKPAKAKATATVGKSFEFQAITANREEKPVTFTITTVERKDEIRVQDKPRRASSGKDYMIVRIELQNNHTERVAIASTDHIRLEDDGGKMFAPDYHNANVVIDPISVRKDLVAFLVDVNTKKFSFQVGELDGPKQKIEINF